MQIISTESTLTQTKAAINCKKIWSSNKKYYHCIFPPNSSRHVASPSQLVITIRAKIAKIDGHLTCRDFAWLSLFTPSCFSYDTLLQAGNYVEFALNKTSPRPQLIHLNLYQVLQPLVQETRHLNTRNKTI